MLTIDEFKLKAIKDIKAEVDLILTIVEELQQEKGSGLIALSEAEKFYISEILKERMNQKITYSKLIEESK
jgi:hypothetical protein